MRRRMFGCVLVAGLGLFAMPTTASAQMGMPGQNNPLYRPPVSPYVNLARGGNAAANYYGVVRPQLAFSRQLQRLQQEQAFMPQFGVPIEEEELLVSVTGHPSIFFNTGHFFGQPGAPIGANLIGQSGMGGGARLGGPIGSAGIGGGIFGPR